MKINGIILLGILIALLGYQITSYCLAHFHGSPYDKWEISMNFDNNRELKVGDEIELYSRYFKTPHFLDKPPTHIHEGKIVDFISGMNHGKAAVLRLESPVAGDSLTGNFLVMELKYKAQTWSTTGPIHLELCNFKPLNRSRQDRRKGEWFESTASFKIKNKNFQKAGL